MYLKTSFPAKGNNIAISTNFPIFNSVVNKRHITPQIFSHLGPAIIYKLTSEQGGDGLLPSSHKAVIIHLSV